jgi:hypothetical protein
MEQYLIDEYGVIEDIDYLKDPADIKEYFLDCGRDYFDCGQGYFETEAVLLVKVKNKFYEVTMDAAIVGERQDRGDKLYYVDKITNISYIEIPKPLPKEQITIQATITGTAENIRFIINHIETHNMHIEYNTIEN